jgi:RsiW-degrading membrane proteinase PrsW (M82 family)
MPFRHPHLPVRLLVPALAAGAVLAASSTPGIVLVAATGPVLAWATLVLLAGGRRRVPWDVVLAALLGGAVVAASLAAFANELALARLPPPVDGHVPIAVAPLLEEAAKALVLLLLVALRRDAFDGPRAGVVWGALVGLGFTWHENLQYLALAALQGGWPGLEQGVAVRGVVGGPVHAVFTAATGAGVGWALVARRRTAAGLALLAGFALAVVQHAAWNGVGSVWVMQAMCGPEFPAVGCTAPPRPVPPLVVVGITLAFVGPGALLAVLAARRRPPSGS